MRDGDDHTNTLASEHAGKQHDRQTKERGEEVGAESQAQVRRCIIADLFS